MHILNLLFFLHVAPVLCISDNFNKIDAAFSGGK